MAGGLVSLVAEDLGDFRLARVNVGERIRAGLARARRDGTRSGRPLGRPRVRVDAAEIVRRRQRGESWREIASGMRLGLGTVLRPQILAMLRKRRLVQSEHDSRRALTSG